MMTLQCICGILLLVYSVAVALPQERKRVRVNHYDEDFGLSSEVPSGENVPVKFGRTIYHSAWSTEDAESSEEDGDESVRTRGEGRKSWTLSKVLRLALNFVNKLRGDESDLPVVRKSKNQNVPESKFKKKSDDVYWKIFKKWLRKNKILKDDDSLSSYLFKHNSRFNDYNHQRREKNPRRNSFGKSKSSRNQNFNGKSNRIRNSKPYINNKTKLSQTPEISNHGVSTIEDRNSKGLSTLYKTRHHNTFNDEECDYSKSLEKDFSDLEDDESCSHASIETDASFSSESDRPIKSNNAVLKKKQGSKFIGEIHPETQTITSPSSDSFGSLINPNQKDTMSYPQEKNKSSLKATTLSDSGTHPEESGVHKTATNNSKEKIVKSTHSNKNQNKFQNQSMLNPTTNIKPIISSFTESPTEQTSDDNKTKKLKTADIASDVNQITTKQNKTSKARNEKDSSKNVSSTQSQAEREKFSKEFPQSPMSIFSPQPHSERTREESSSVIGNGPFTTTSENVPLSESQGETTQKKNTENSQVSEKVVPVGSISSKTKDKSISKENSGDFPKDESISQATISPSQEKNTFKEISNDSRGPQNLPLTKVPENSSSSKPSGESILKENQIDLRETEDVAHVTSSSPSESQNIGTLTENSDGFKVTEEGSQAVTPANGSSSQTLDDNLLKLTSPYSTFSSDSTPSIQEKNIINKSSNVVEKDSQTEIPAGISSPKTTNENGKIAKSNSQELNNLPFATDSMSTSSSEPRSIKLLKETSKNSPVNKKVPQQQTLISSSPRQTTDEKIINEKSNDLPMIKSIPEVTEFSKGSQRETVPTSASSSESQIIRTLNQNSKNSQFAEKDSKPAGSPNSSSPQTTDEIIIKQDLNDSPVDKSISQATEPLTISTASSSSPQTTDKTIRKETSNDSPMDESVSRATEPLTISTGSSSSPQTTDETIKRETSNDSPVDKSVLQATEPLVISPLDKNILKETTKASHIPDSMKSQPFIVSKLQPRTKNIQRENEKTPEINKRVPSLVYFSPQSNKKHVLKENFKTEDISTTLSETSDYSSSEELESDSYIISEGTDMLNEKNINTINLSGKENVGKSSDLKRSTKYAETLKEKSQLTENQSFSSSSVEELTDSEVAIAEDPQQEKFDTFLQYMYKHSNSSYFQALQNESNNSSVSTSFSNL